MSILVAAYISYFLRLTNKQVIVWTNSETLFENAVLTCPESAKMQMQLSQVFMSEQYIKDKAQFEKAKFHLEAARRIDPEFCDLDLKFAQISLAGGHVYDALGLYIKSLTCIYTNSMAIKTAETLFKLLQSNEQTINTIDPELHQLLGAYYHLVGKYVEAAKEYTLSAYSALYDYTPFLAKQQYVSKQQVINKTLEALRALSQVEEGLSKSRKQRLLCESLHIQGRYHEASGEDEAAIEDYLNAFSMRSTDTDVTKYSCEEIQPGLLSAAVRCFQRHISKNNSLTENLVKKSYISTLKLAEKINVPSSQPDQVAIINEYLMEAKRLEEKSVKP